MPDSPTDRDKALRAVLTELSMGRLTVDEAYAKVGDLSRPAPRSNPRKAGAATVGLILLLIGTVFACVGGFFAAKSLSFSRDAAHAEGTVVRLERTGNKGNQIPIVNYTVDGREHELRGDVGSNLPPEVNSKVRVIYKIDDPAKAQIDSFVERWLFPVIFGGVGCMLALGGLIIVVGAVIRKLVTAGGEAERFTV